MKVQATLYNYRRSSKKVVETARIVRGLGYAEALAQLEQTSKKDSDVLIKLIKSAAANAQNNFRLDKEDLYVENILIGAGATLKRWMPRAHGRAASILKRTCQLTVILDEKKVDPKKKAEEKKPAMKEAVESKAEKKGADEKKESAKKEKTAEKK